MRSRRSVLHAGAATAIVGVSGVAGCTIDPGSGGDTAPESERATDASGDDQSGDGTGEGAGERALRQVSSAFGTLFADLRRTVENDDVRPADVEPRRQLDSTESSLDGAESAVSTDERDRFRTLRELHRVATRLVTSVERFHEGTTSFRAMLDAIDAGRYDDAEAEIDAWRDRFGDATRFLDDFRDQFERIENSVDAFDEIDTDDARAVVDEVAPLASAFGDVVPGADATIQAQRAYDAALADYEAENWDAARSGFREAVGRFDQATEAVADARPDDRTDPDELLDRLECRAETRGDAAEHYLAATGAARRDDWDEVEAEERKARDALEQCD
jgi:TolA-binding protein